MILTPDELRELTRATRHARQCDALRAMGIPFKIRPDGSPAVLRAAAEAALGHATTQTRSASVNTPESAPKTLI